MTWIAPDAWVPHGISDLEPNAWQALRTIGSVCVVAGPGSGKTEFLAQRATYLLTTGLCPPPYRILAISFKGDSAQNLASRVRERCPSSLAGRFVSLTFDAFTKGLLDRFQLALPEVWRPTRPYQVVFPSRPETQGFLDGMRVDAPPKWQAEVVGLSATSFEARNLGAWKLPLAPRQPVSGTEMVVQEWWENSLRKGKTSSLTFVMINRLAELLVRACPHIRRALRAAYRFVFVDEFQDTTYAQYDFLHSAFGDSGPSVTAVGDDKQRIMAWAGARIDSFERFQADFKGLRVPLLLNFRSSTDLVKTQHIVARALDSSTELITSRAETTISGDVAQIWRCKSEVEESNHLASWIADDIKHRGTQPRDYALLVRQKADRFETEFREPLSALGIGLRNESRTVGRMPLQDLLADALAGIALAFLRLGAERRAPQAWTTACVALQRLRGADPDDHVALYRAEKELIDFISSLRKRMVKMAPTPSSSRKLSEDVFKFMDLAAVAQTFLDYSSGQILEITVEAFVLHMQASSDPANNWTDCIQRFLGVNEVPIMTVHKSKGLEFDTILFVGLEDRMWWSYSPKDPEGLSTLFVALSRAKQRVIFTYCKARGSRTAIADLYRLLTEAGVPEIVI